MNALLSFLNIGEDTNDINETLKLKEYSQLLARTLQVLEISRELFKQIEHLCSTSTFIMQYKTIYYIDPNAMDSRCQIHAGYVWESLHNFKTMPSVSKFFHDFFGQVEYQSIKLKSVLENIQSTLKHCQKDTNREKANMVREIIKSTTIASIAKRLGGDAELATRLQILHIYFFLSCRRQHNVDVLSSDIWLLMKQMMNNKIVYSHLKLAAQQHATKLEKLWKINLHQPTNATYHSYMESFLSCTNFWKMKKLPIVAFINRQCYIHGIHQLRAIVNWQKDNLEICTDLPLGEISIILCFESAPTIDKQCCSLEEWKETLRKQSFTKVILSYAYCHVNSEELLAQQPHYDFISECKIFDKSIALLKHVYAGPVPFADIVWECK